MDGAGAALFHSFFAHSKKRNETHLKSAMLAAVMPHLNVGACFCFCRRRFCFCLFVLRGV
jgi:hypothetical protein